jgi:hypothetical protein
MKNLAIQKEKIFVAKSFKEIPICNQDKTNVANFICTKCKTYWCKNCMKFDLHKDHLINFEQFEFYVEKKRKNLLNGIESSVMTDQYYTHLEKIEIALNDRINEIENQFNDVIKIIEKMKEAQYKFLKEQFYKEMDSQKFKSVITDIKFFRNKLDEIVKIEEAQENLNFVNSLTNNDILEGYKTSINENYSEFKNVFVKFHNIYLQHENFNRTLISQLEAKFRQSETIKNLLNNEENLKEISKEDALKGFVNLTKTPNSQRSQPRRIPRLYKVKYYNTILEWDYVRNTMKRIDDFKDVSDFKINYQVYSGNIFLNHSNRLFIITGINYNLFYFYDKSTNEIYKLPNLSQNHCRGSLAYLSRLNSIICISGKYTNKCEIFSLKNFETDSERNQNIKNSNEGEITRTETKKKVTLKIFKNITPKTTIPSNPETIMPNNTQICVNSDLNWKEFPQLNYQRYYSSVYIFNDHYLYIFFGYNTSRGSIDIVERININTTTIFSSYWEIVNYNNPSQLDMRLHSHSCIYANTNEVYIVGGSKNEIFSDKILKYNLINNTIFMTDMIIPDINKHEYFRFWEESQFKQLISHELIENKSEDDYTFAMFDARDKMHVFNSRTFKYKII